MKLKGGLQPTPRDSKDLPAGALFRLPTVAELPPDFIIEGYRIKDQGDTDYCSAYMATGLSELQEGVELWPEYSFAASKDLTGDIDAWGQNLRAAFKTLVKIGSVEQKDAVRVKNPRLLSSYPAELKAKALAHRKQTYLEVGPTQGLDAFDAIRATMYRFRNEKRAVGTGVTFSWSVTDHIFDTIGEGFGHAMSIVGWKTIDGTPYLIYANSAGKRAGDKGFHYVSREVVNHFVRLYEAFMVVDMAREDVEYMLQNGIQAEDNWIVQLLKVIKTVVLSPFFTNEEKNHLLDVTTRVVETKIQAIQDPRERLLAAAKEWIGKDASAEDNAPDELACAESVSNIIRSSVAPDFPICLSTAELKSKLAADKRFRATLDIKPGVILVSPTGSGNGTIANGHTGIFLTPTTIASNDSRDGLWRENYTLDAWIKRYRTKGGFPLICYEPVSN